MVAQAPVCSELGNLMSVIIKDSSRKFDEKNILKNTCFSLHAHKVFWATIWYKYHGSTSFLHREWTWQISFFSFVSRKSKRDFHFSCVRNVKKKYYEAMFINLLHFLLVDVFLLLVTEHLWWTITVGKTTVAGENLSQETFSSPS